MKKFQEVILELCQIVQEFLYERNKPPQGSFFDGMVQQHAAVEHERKVSCLFPIYSLIASLNLW